MLILFCDGRGCDKVFMLLVLELRHFETFSLKSFAVPYLKRYSLLLILLSIAEVGRRMRSEKL